jgi:hypothetical protein
MPRFTDLRVHVEWSEPPTWAWECAHCGAAEQMGDLDTMDELVDLAEMHGGCAGALLDDALDELEVALENRDAASSAARIYWWPR